MSEIETLVKGLTRAQKKALKTAEFHSGSGEWRCPYVIRPADKNLRAKGLANGLWVALTPLGLQVRDYLKGQS